MWVLRLGWRSGRGGVWLVFFWIHTFGFLFWCDTSNNHFFFYHAFASHEFGRAVTPYLVVSLQRDCRPLVYLKVIAASILSVSRISTMLLPQNGAAARNFLWCTTAMSGKRAMAVNSNNAGRTTSTIPPHAAVRVARDENISGPQSSAKIEESLSAWLKIPTVTRSWSCEYSRMG